MRIWRLAQLQPCRILQVIPLTSTCTSWTRLDGTELMTSRYPASASVKKSMPSSVSGHDSLPAGGQVMSLLADS